MSQKAEQLEAQQSHSAKPEVCNGSITDSEKYMHNEFLNDFNDFLCGVPTKRATPLHRSRSSFGNCATVRSRHLSGRRLVSLTPRLQSVIDAEAAADEYLRREFYVATPKLNPTLKRRVRLTPILEQLRSELFRTVPSHLFAYQNTLHAGATKPKLENLPLTAESLDKLGLSEQSSPQAKSRAVLEGRW
eukprot:Lankesteria_metandrocarpae@DN3266_c0_g2_i2.p1